VKRNGYYVIAPLPPERQPRRDCAEAMWTMTESEFHDSLKTAAAPEGLSLPLLALWHDARGDWSLAHETVQDDESPNGAWVHAYLHRKEGDRSNAAYWYTRARQPEARGSLDAERTAIIHALLTQPD
jgi:hypothetical protein